MLRVVTTLLTLVLPTLRQPHGPSRDATVPPLHLINKRPHIANNG
jgi:hypothetical protein